MRRKETKYEQQLKKKIGERLRLLRERLDKEQDDIARETGFSQSLISCWEQGKYTPRITYFPILAKVYGINDASVSLLLPSPPSPPLSSRSWQFAVARKGSVSQASSSLP
jgi:transcriptional regulator with XRE-family HTH domain